MPEVLEKIEKGYTQRQIAEKLGLGDKVVHRRPFLCCPYKLELFTYRHGVFILV